MTILADSRLDVSIVPADPTDLDRDYAATTSPYADEWHADEPTPIELLEEWVADDDDGPAHWTTVIRGGKVVCTDRPRYEARELETFWIVWDEMNQEVTHCFDSGRAAKDRAIDLNAEDFPECPDWTWTAPPSEILDGWKVTPTRI